MKILTGLFRAARKRAMTKDNDMGTFRESITELVEKRKSFSDDGVAAKVEELKGMASDLPDGEGKEKLVRFLEDFKSVKEQDESAAREAAKMVADLFEKLDTEAMKDTPNAEDALLSVNASGNNVSAANAGANNGVSKDGVIGNAIKAVTGAKDGEAGEESAAGADSGAKDDAGETGADNANAQYTLEEIYQFIKKRMAEDCAKDGAEESTETETKTEETKKSVKDNAPRIPVTMNKACAPGTLGDMFAKIKSRRN